MNPDLLPPELAPLAEMIAPAWARANALTDQWARPEILLAFVAGAASVFTGARLLLLAAGLLGAAEIAGELGHLDAPPDWLLPLSAALAALGALQGVVTVLFGPDTFGDLMVWCLGVAVAATAFLIWRGPLALAGLLRRAGGRG